MQSKVILISEAKLIPCIVLASIPIGIIFLVIAAELSGGGFLENGVYYGAFGPLVYLIFFGGAAYAFYEFVKLIRGRLHYLTCEDGCLHILHQKSVSLDKILTLTIKKSFWWEDLVLEDSEGAITRIRGYLLKKDVSEVKETVLALQKSRGK